MSNKVWQVMPKVKLDYNLKFPNLSWITLQLLYNRGIKEEEAINIFLNPEFNRDLNDPFIFKDMAKVVDLIIKHIKNENLIIIYGDYDADGVTASALLYEVLSTLKAKCEIYIPDRVSEGYGLNKEAIEEIAKMGAKLIITVDGGIRNKEEVEYGLKKDLEIIITDHHVPPEKAEDLPACLILNPLADVDYPNKKLAGVGVAFKLAQAIITKAKLDDEIKNKLVDKVLDLVAIGTVADCVSLTGENRIFVKLGLEILNKTNRLGLQELIKVAKINNNKDLDTWNIGWQIGPRLNAAGRMEHANSAFELLITRNVDEAKAIARRLNDKNNERQKITNQIAEEIEQEISKKDDLKIIIAINKKEQGWPEGIIGLVAGRICEKYYLPTLVITKTEEGYKGSGRSIPEFNIVEAILKNSKYLEKYGGHPAACGFSLKEDNLDNFAHGMEKIVKKKLSDIALQPKIKIDATLDLAEINENLIKELERFAPFGEGNPKPKFLSQGVQIRDIVKMGIDSQHIKFRINGMWALAFNQAEEWQDFKINDLVDIVYYIEMNYFNGREELQLKVVDIKNNNPN